MQPVQCGAGTMANIEPWHLNSRILLNLKAYRGFESLSLRIPILAFLPSNSREIPETRVLSTIPAALGRNAETVR